LPSPNSTIVPVIPRGHFVIHLGTEEQVSVCALHAKTKKKERRREREREKEGKKQREK